MQLWSCTSLLPCLGGELTAQEFALFEPGARHVGMDIMGTNKANPSAMILSATMMLRHLGLESQANLIASAVYDIIKEGKVRTPDMKGEYGAAVFGQS